MFLLQASLFYLTKVEPMPEAWVDSGGEQSWQGKQKQQSCFQLSQARAPQVDVTKRPNGPVGKSTPL